MWLVLLGLSVLLIVTAFTDLAHGLVYDWVTIPAACLGLLAQTLADGWAGTERAALGLAVAVGVFGLGVLLGGLGGGDLKAMAAVGALGGYPFILWAILYTIVIGGVIGVGVLIRSGPGNQHHQTVPYGLAIAVGTASAWLIQGL